MASTYGSLQTPIFIGNNYEYWSLTMKALFGDSPTWLCITNRHDNT